MNQSNVIILGGGNAGLSVAAQLLAKQPKISVQIVEPSDKHYYQPAWTLVGGGAFDIKDTVRDEKDYIPKGATWVKASCQEIDPDKQELSLDNGQILRYDVLIVTVGLQLDWHKIKGLEGNLGRKGISSNYSFKYAPYTFEALKATKKGRALFTNPNTPIKCGGAPQKIMYLAADYFRKQKLAKQIETHFYSAGGLIFGIPKYAETLNQVIERYGILTHFHHNLVEVRADEQVAVFERGAKVQADGAACYGQDLSAVAISSDQQFIEQKFDFLHITPPQSAPDFIKKSPLAVADNPLGWLEVDKFGLFHPRYPNVFACGDVSNTPNAKTGAAVRKQAPVVVANVLHWLEQGEAGKARYEGYGSCPLVTGYGKLVLAEFDYDNKPVETFFFNQAKERYSMWLLKRHALPWLYWNRILSGKA